MVSVSIIWPRNSELYIPPTPFLFPQIANCQVNSNFYSTKQLQTLSPIPEEGDKFHMMLSKKPQYTTHGKILKVIHRPSESMCWLHSVYSAAGQMDGHTPTLVDLLRCGGEGLG